MDLRGRQRLLVLAVPALVYGILLVVPLAMLVRMSFREFGRTTGTRDVVSLQTYRAILSEPSYLNSWIRTMELALVTAAITTVVATVVAFVMWRIGGRFRAYFTILVLAPLFISGVARSYGWIAAVGPGGGLPTLTGALGLGEVSFIFNKTAVIVGFVNVLMPFAVLTILVRLDSIQPSVLRAAASLGSAALRTVRSVILPIAMPAVSAAFLVAFALASTSYAVPSVLGGGRVRVIATQIVNEQRYNFDLPRAAALSVLLSVITVALMAIAQALRTGSRGRNRARSARKVPPTVVH